MEYLFPEVLKHVVGEELERLKALPDWAIPVPDSK